MRMAKKKRALGLLVVCGTPFLLYQKKGGPDGLFLKKGCVWMDDGGCCFDVKWSINLHWILFGSISVPVLCLHFLWPC